MKLPVYVVDAFTDKLFCGNPAAVCPLEHWLSDNIMQHLAAENNLSETVFFIKNDDHYDIRWFTPTTEVKLCGHATLASAHVMMSHDTNFQGVVFDSLSGKLSVAKAGTRLELDFPRHDVHPQPEALAK